MSEEPHWLVPEGWNRVEVIEGIHQTYRILFYPNGEHRFEHPCRAGDGSLIINAPLISHELTTHGDDGTVSAAGSLRCLGCGLHGWVRHGRWTDA